MKNYLLALAYGHRDWLLRFVTEAEMLALDDGAGFRTAAEVPEEAIEVFKEIRWNVNMKGGEAAEITVRGIPGPSGDMVFPAVRRGGKWVPNLSGSEFFKQRVEQYKDVKARVWIANLRNACEVYEVDMGEQPVADTLEELVALFLDYGYTEEDVRERDGAGKILDPWGRPYVYVPAQEPGGMFALHSIGPDGKDENGGGDDISGVR